MIVDAGWCDALRMRCDAAECARAMSVCVDVATMMRYVCVCVCCCVTSNVVVRVDDAKSNSAIGCATLKQNEQRHHTQMS